METRGGHRAGLLLLWEDTTMAAGFLMRVSSPHCAQDGWHQGSAVETSLQCKWPRPGPAAWAPSRVESQFHASISGEKQGLDTPAGVPTRGHYLMQRNSESSANPQVRIWHCKRSYVKSKKFWLPGGLERRKDVQGDVQSSSHVGTEEMLKRSEIGPTQIHDQLCG